MAFYMGMIDRLIRVADAYAAATGTDELTVSAVFFGHTRKLGKLRDGKDMVTRRAEGVFDHFNRSWPTDVAKPIELTSHDPTKSQPPLGAPAKRTASTLCPAEPPARKARSKR